ncbi:uncharacterized protein LOC113547909 isoform X1 [Rhopalosiphum maidis]|uniref:uncharacterized protein LOC113547909 isoform X1 n=2 Tax=Rhopalosiphum maidis TaxID=43146 RepID=UPI000F000CAF|nr:uncharacterized protein LOC113547909 isoform X1 [Rhopalosiphum maidis]
MYSDMIESPSKDCFSFNDQSLSYDMAEVNEMNNQANLDYIFDSYYSSVSRYNTGFELPEDCKNMSFSELFDQELFSTHVSENKDCQITIKIEKEEPLNECYSTDNSIDTTGSSSFIKVEENIPSSSLLSKSFVPKRGINRTSIKTMGTSDVEHLIHNPFCETEEIDNQISETINSSIIKCEAEDVNDNVKEDLVEIKVNPHYSADVLQNNTDLKKSKENIVSSLSLKSSTTKRQGNNRISINTPDISVKHLNNPFCELKDLGDNRIPVQVNTPFIKCEPKVDFDIIEDPIVEEINLHYSVDGSQNTFNGHNMVKVKNSVSKYGSPNATNNHNIVKVSDSVTYSLKNSSPKHRQINKISIKTFENCNVKHLYNSICEPKRLGDDQTPTLKYKTSKHLGINQTQTVKIESENVNNSLEKLIVKKKVKSCYSVDSRNFVKGEDKVSSLLLKNSTSKRQVNNKKSVKATENCGVKHNAHNLHCEPKKIDNDQISVKLTTPIMKCESEDFYDLSKENIKYSSAQLQGMVESHSWAKNIDEIILPSSPKGFISQHRGANSSTKTNTNSDIKNPVIYDLNYKPKDLDNITSVKGKMPIIERKHENNSTIQPNNLKYEKVTKSANPNEIHSVKLIDVNAKNQEVIIKNTETIVSPIKTEDIDTQTDKKKISWEEFRAKREKMGLINNSKIKEEPATDIVTTDDDKMKAMQEEFDRTTAEHFTGQKRKIDDKEEETITAKEINNEEEELQKKRMKIEYIKKLLPSSFASEIAKTSSLMKGSLVEDNDNENTSDDSTLSSDKTQGKYLNTYDKSQKKGYQSRVHSSHRVLSRADYNNKSSRSSSSSSDDYYNRNRTDTPSQGVQHSQNTRTTLQRPKEQKRVVYVGQIPIKLGKRYLYNRFKEFGTIQSLTLHKKPDFRVYYAFVTYSENLEADRAINHGNDDESQVQLDIRFGERKQTQTPYYDLDDEWLTDWYGYKQPLAPVVKTEDIEKVSFEEELQEFYKLSQIKKLNQIKSSQAS